jgi:hypothetical protein
MKSRNREINIFNMSLLDVLCGALGAFCFMMLVLFPFYSQDKGAAKAPDIPPPGIDPKNYEDAMARIKELEDLVKKFQNYSGQADAQQKRQESQINQLQGDLNTAQNRNTQLEMRKPLLAVGRFDLSDTDFVQVYVEDDREAEGGKKGEKVDPTKDQATRFTGDFDARGEGANLTYYMVRDAPQGEYRVFAKIIKHPPSNHPITGYVAIQVEGKLEVTPGFTVTQEHMAIPIAVVTTDQDHKQTIRMVLPKEFQPAPAPDQGKK